MKSCAPGCRQCDDIHEFRAVKLLLPSIKFNWYSQHSIVESWVCCCHLFNWDEVLLKKGNLFFSCSARNLFALYFRPYDLLHSLRKRFELFSTQFNSTLDTHDRSSCRKSGEKSLLNQWESVQVHCVVSCKKQSWACFVTPTRRENARIIIFLHTIAGYSRYKGSSSN